MEPVIEYVDTIKNLDEYKRMVELNNIIKAKYGSLIMSFKSLEAQYLELDDYAKYRSDVCEIKSKFIEKKKELYSKPEVKEYFSLERKLNEYLNDDMNELKKSISNKFTLNKIIKL